MDDGRETSVQTDMFLILTCDSFEHYLLSISPSCILYQKFYSLSLKKSIDLKDRERK